MVHRGTKPPRQEREERLLAEFLAEFFPTAQVRTRVRLGNVAITPPAAGLEEAERRLLKNMARWVDALVIRPTDVILVEAEILPSPGGPSTLAFYERAMRNDPDFAELLSLPLRKMLVWAFDDPTLRRVAEEFGVEVRVFSPPWIREALLARFPDMNRPRRPSRPTQV